jgi:hypothetical protein
MPFFCTICRVEYMSGHIILFGLVMWTGCILKLSKCPPMKAMRYSTILSYLHSCRLSGRNLLGVPSRDSNSGLPYSKPARYQLSHAAPWRWASANVYYHSYCPVSMTYIQHDSAVTGSLPEGDR